MCYLLSSHALLQRGCFDMTEMQYIWEDSGGSVNIVWKIQISTASPLELRQPAAVFVVAF